MIKIELISRYIGRKNSVKRYFSVAPTTLLMACGSTSLEKQIADVSENTNEGTISTTPTAPEEGVSSSEDIIVPEVDTPTEVIDTVTPESPTLDDAPPSYEILQYDLGPLFPEPSIDYAPQVQIDLPPLDQSYAESYLSGDKNITQYKVWSGDNTLDALLFGNPVFPGRTDQVWIGSGASNILSFSFVDPNLILLDEGAYGYNYAGGAQPINAVYNGSIGAFTEAQKDAIRQAFAEYEKCIDLKFVEVTEVNGEVGTLRIGLSLSEFDNIAAFALQPARYWASAGDIWLFNEAVGQDFTPGESWYYYAFLHELGHALGLKHPHEAIRDNELILDETLDAANYTLMSYNEPDWGWYSHRGDEIWTISHGPQVLDIQALQYLYGPNFDHNSENTIYEFSPVEPVSLTIWDGGGIDILDFSQMVVSLTISLEPGSFSTVPIRGWSPSDNIGIAYGTVIENVIGSRADDVITGNASDNFLSGHDGNDTLYGGDGNDTFDWHENSRSGSDLFVGGTGDDTYYMSVGDALIEQASEGVDTIILVDNQDFETPQHVERVIVAHQFGATIVGNELDNTLMGGAGDDILTGAGGADTFLVSENMGHDLITDFDAAQGDEIMFANSPMELLYTETDTGFFLDFDSNGSLKVLYSNIVA